MQDREYRADYTQTKIRKGKWVYVTREIARQDMAIICKD
jgi:hypothetical protein